MKAQLARISFVPRRGLMAECRHYFRRCGYSGARRS